MDFKSGYANHDTFMICLTLTHSNKIYNSTGYK